MNLETPEEETGGVPHHEEFENAEWRRDDPDEEQKAFLEHLNEFMTKRGTPITRMPQLAHKDVDLRTLYTSVIKHGGLHQVEKKNLWKEIVKEFNFPKPITNAAYMLRLDYIKYLYPYERHFYFGLPDNGVDYGKPKPKYRVEEVEIPAESTQTADSTSNVAESKPTIEPPRALYQALPVILQDFNKTPIPYESSRLFNKNKEGLAIRKLHEKLLSNSVRDQALAINALLIKSTEKDFQLSQYPHIVDLITQLCDKLWRQHKEEKANTNPMAHSNPFIFELSANRNSALVKLVTLVTAIRNCSMLPSNQYALGHDQQKLVDLLCTWISLDTTPRPREPIHNLNELTRISKNNIHALVSAYRPDVFGDLYAELAFYSLETLANIVHHVPFAQDEQSIILDSDANLSDAAKHLRLTLPKIAQIILDPYSDTATSTAAIVLLAKIASNTFSKPLFVIFDDDLVIRLFDQLATHIIADTEETSEWAAYGLAQLAQRCITRAIAARLCQNSSLLPSLILILRNFAAAWRLSPDESVGYDRRRFIATQIALVFRKMAYKETKDYFLPYEDLFVELSFASGMIGNHLSHLVQFLASDSMNV